MAVQIPKFSFPVPAGKNGKKFSSAKKLLEKLAVEDSGLYLVGRQGMWHGGIHITDTTAPWCALSSGSLREKKYSRGPFKGEQFIRCMADGEIVAWRINRDYESNAIKWRNDELHQSSSFVLIKHRIKPGETEASALDFYTLYMHLAPFSIYGADVNKCKVKSTKNYYLSEADTRAGKSAGALNANAVVTRTDNIITRASDKRQFTEVILTAETQRKVGKPLPAGTHVWTVSDRGSLVETQGGETPPWWAKCTPAYKSKPEGVVSCTTRTGGKIYLSEEDTLAQESAGELAANFPLTYDPATHLMTCPAENSQDNTEHMYRLVMLGQKFEALEKGDRVWIVSDDNNLIPVSSDAGPKFDSVEQPPKPIAIKAGEGVGHMGFYELPEENGKTSRYQVHIECLSTGDVENFLSNPEHVNEKDEDLKDFISYPEGASLYVKDGDGTWKDTTRKTRSSGILTLTKVPTEPPESSNKSVSYYQIYNENGWVKAADATLVAQYSLDKLGFLALDRESGSFDLIDGIHQPDNVVKGILEQLYKATQEETRTQYMLNHYNYKRLLDQIDSNKDGHYSQEEYLMAVHNASYRGHLYRIVAKHDSEWYYGKDDPLWQAYLNTLNDIPHWKKYTEEYVEKMAWMKKVPGMESKVWHMHPVVFLEALSVGVITLKMVLAANLSNNEKQCKIVVSYLNKYANAYGMEDEKEIAHFLSQIGHESGFEIIEENLNYSAKGMRRILGCIKGPKQYNKDIDDCNLGRLRNKLWTEPDNYSNNPESLANYVYANRMGNGDESSGDGYKYRGRGMIQLTGKDGYQYFTNKHNEMSPDNEQDFVGNPDLVISEIEYGVESAFSFWLSKGLNKTAKTSNVKAVTEKVNGGQTGYADRLQRFNAVAPLLGLDKE